MTNSQMLKLSEIIPDPNQPRKFFDQLALDELTASAKSIGIFQNILVRPCSPKVQNGRKAIYMIVVGERRYKASVAAGLKEIPATIRELTDEQALEIQIVENLLRKDVQPMEEAVAFKSLFNHNHFAVEEIAARVGKSPSYVAGRIKLCDLLPDFQEILFNNKMQLTDAMRLSKFDIAVQKQLLDEKAKGWKKQGPGWNLGNISWYLNNAQNNLGKATFKLNDTLLYKEAGSCTVCPHNSACNPVLFEEFAKEKICHNSICYGIKTDRAYQKKLEDFKQKPDMIFIADTSYINDQEKHKITVAEEMGITVLPQKAFEKVEDPIPPPTWEAYWEEQKEWRLEEDMTEEEINEAIADEKDSWQDDVTEYEEAVKNIQEAKASGRVVKAFVVCGNGQGKTIDIILTPKKGGTGMTDDDNTNLQLQLAALHEKEKRNLELDREKIYVECTAALKEPFTTSYKSFITNRHEWIAIAVLMADISYKARDFAKDEIGSKTTDYEHLDLYHQLLKMDYNKSINIICRMIRIAIFEKMVSDTYADFKKYGKAAAMYGIAEAYINPELDGICTAQAEKTAKRNANIQKQIDFVKAKLQALTDSPAPAEEPLTVPPSTPPGAEIEASPAKVKGSKKKLETEVA